MELLEEDWKQLKNSFKNHPLEIFINLIFNELTEELTKIEEIKNIKQLLEKGSIL